MKRQASNQQTTKTNISLYLLGLILLLCSLLSCSDPFAGIGSGDDSCKLESSLFDGQYLVSDLCNAKWGSSDNYIITMSLNQDPNVIGCAWNIQNLLGTKTNNSRLGILLF